MQKILDYLASMWGGFIDKMEQFTTFLLDKLLVWSIDFMMWISELAADFFSSIITGLALDTQLNSYVTQLHPSIGYVFDALNIATYIQIIVAAYITRLVLKFTIPGY